MNRLLFKAITLVFLIAFPYPAAAEELDLAGRENLHAVPLPDLQSLEPSVAKQLHGFQERLASALAVASAPHQDLGDGFGFLGQLYHAYELYSSAEAAYRNASILDDPDARWPYLLGKLLVATGRLEESLECFAKTRKREPEYAPCMVHAGNALLELDREVWLPRVKEKLAPLLESLYRPSVLNVLARGADPEILELLIGDSASDQRDLALLAIQRLVFYRTDEAVQALWKAARTGIDEIRREAWFALLESGQESAFKRLDGMLLSRDPRDRIVAAEVLAGRPERASGPQLTLVVLAVKGGSEPFLSNAARCLNGSYAGWGYCPSSRSTCRFSQFTSNLTDRRCSPGSVCM